MKFQKSLGVLALSMVVSTSFGATKTKSKAGNKDLSAPAVLEVDTSATVLKWEGRKVTGAHHGQVPLKSGSVNLAGDRLVGGKFEVSLADLTVEDITDPETKAKFLGHMKSEDFFATQSFPVATFVIKDVKALKSSEGSHSITGDLTIKDQTQSITFPAKVVSREGRVTADAVIVVDRTKFGLKYGSGSFFKGLGDKAIDNNFTLNLSLKTKG